MDHDISGLHHVGHLVHDMEAALDRYRRLGFTLPGPAYPVLGEPFGTGNTHAYFPGDFVLGNTPACGGSRACTT
jgi:catechol 2,3-dioxygenase-like lactoylglutathione lyase family enzyme